MLVKTCYSFLFLWFIFEISESRDRIWRFSSDISAPENWIDGKLAKNCKGIHFATTNSAPVYITELVTSELTLPIDGEIDIIEGGFIEFKDNNKCIKLKPIKYHSWFDPSSWSPIDNVAVPDKERVPCASDDVVLPNPYHARILEPTGLVEIKSFKFWTETADQLGAKAANDIFHSPDGATEVVLKSPCTDPYGCRCHDTYVPCLPAETTKKIACLDPVLPEEFCDEICGAYVSFEAGKGPHLADLRRKLGEYSVDTYASRVRDYLGKDVVQVVFSEAEYTGKSLEEAERFFQFLKSANVDNLQIFQSGQYYREGGTRTNVGIVLGTLCLVCVFFGVLLYLNSDKTSLAVLMSRLNSGRGSVFSAPFFARFDNIDQNLIIDGQSETGSILDIAKSFDNPLYGHSSTSTDHENPLYEATKEEKVDVEE